jgi:hypothetical protein
MKNEILKRLEKIEGRERSECPNVIDIIQAMADANKRREPASVSNPEVERIMKEYYEEKNKRNASKDEIERTCNLIL